MKKILLGLVLVFVVFAGACAGNETDTNAAAFKGGLDEQGCGFNENVDTLKVAVTPVVDAVAPGGTAEFRVLVVRDADISPDLKSDLQGSDMDGAGVEAPVEGAVVWQSFSLPDNLSAWGAGITDEDGIATIRIKVRKTTPAGAYDSNTFASRDVTSGPCMHVAEQGSYHREEALTVE